MPTPKLGKLEPVDMREVWPDEARDFTPWLAENLDLLSDALHMDLELVQEEAPVGRFSLDIRARERRRNVAVAIENQLGYTDHTHLGQLLTYAAGIDARILVWVTPELLDEHRAALDWLNRWTGEEIEVYGVEARAVRVGESCPAPELRPLVFPKAWSDRTSGGLLPSSRRYRDFFQPLVDELQEKGFTDRRNAWANANQEFPSQFEGISYYAGFWRSEAWVYLWITGSDRDRNKHIFDGLHDQRTAIERELNAEVAWLRHNNQPWSSIGVSMDGSIDDPEDKLAEVRAWMLDRLPKLKEAIHPRLQEVMSELRTGEVQPDTPS